MKFSSKKVASLKAAITEQEKQVNAARKESARAWKVVKQKPGISWPRDAWKAYQRADDKYWQAERRLADAEYALVCYLMQFATPSVQRWVKSELSD